MSAHTPGPWTYSQDEGAKVYMIQVERDAQPIARVAWFEAESNACLIAAAPELLEALEGCMDYFEDMKNAGVNAAYFMPDTKWLLPVRAAIAKAKGDK